MKYDVDVLVIGGGIVGLSAALAMAMRNTTVAIIDTGLFNDISLELPISRVYAINHASKILFKQLGVWSLIDESRIAPYRHMYVWDAKNCAHIDFDARLIASPALGFILEESVIKKALLQRLMLEKNITYYPSTTVTRIVSHDEMIKVHSDQQTWQARLLMIADGANSQMRKLLDIPIITWPYHQHALIATIDTEKHHAQTAYQVFNPDGPLALLPLIDNHQCSIVWSTTVTRATYLARLPEEQFNEELGKAFAYKLGKVALNSKRHTFPLFMRQAKRYVGKNWIILGDAAHTIHPLAGLGLNIGLADVAVWLSCLEIAPKQYLSKRTLDAYQRQRKYAVWQMISLMGSLKTLFVNPCLPVIAFRGLGLALCNRLTPLKRLLIEQATGYTI